VHVSILFYTSLEIELPFLDSVTLFFSAIFAVHVIVPESGSKNGRCSDTVPDSELSLLDGLTKNQQHMLQLRSLAQDLEKARRVSCVPPMIDSCQRVFTIR
jgi:hypothetical protein